MNSILGEIRMFAGTFAPVGWAFCDGSDLKINDYPDLFNLLGTTYGGDGITTFALPDLKGRMPVSYGSGSGMPDINLGLKLGSEEVKLSQQEMLSHTHDASGSVKVYFKLPYGGGSTWDPTGINLSSEQSVNVYVNKPANQTMAGGIAEITIDDTGGGQAHDNVQPYLAINFIISLKGGYPENLE